MREGGEGGANTVTGLVFERKTDLLEKLSGIAGYRIDKNTERAGANVFFQNQLVARCFKKHEFYRYLKEEGINWREKISQQLLPDNAILVICRDTLFIIEVKYQQVAGSVDEKLQTCDFKRKQYLKLVRDLGLRIEYVYVLNDWFKQPRYKDVLDYIHSVNCHYLFNELPLKWLGLPTSEFSQSRSH